VKNRLNTYGPLLFIQISSDILELELITILVLTCLTKHESFALTKSDHLSLSGYSQIINCTIIS